MPVSFLTTHLTIAAAYPRFLRNPGHFLRRTRAGLLVDTALSGKGQRAYSNGQTSKVGIAVVVKSSECISTSTQSQSASDKVHTFQNRSNSRCKMQWRSVDPSELLAETCKHRLLRDAEPDHCFLAFRAGFLSLSEDRKLKSDKRKGQVLLLQCEEPGFINVQWYERDVDECSGTSTLQASPLIDQMVFEGEAAVSWVGPKERRVLRVVFSEEPDRNMFFWLQEPDNSNDDLIITRFGDCINKTSVSGQWQDREAVPASAQTSDQVVADAFAKFFAAAAEQQNGVNLEDVLTPDVVERVAAQPGISNRLVEFLPEGMQNQEELIALARAPPFWQQVRALGSAVQRGTIDGRQFGIAATEPGILGFLKGLQVYVDTDRQEQKGMWKLIGQGDPGAAGSDPMDE